MYQVVHFLQHIRYESMIQLNLTHHLVRYEENMREEIIM